MITITIMIKIYIIHFKCKRIAESTKSTIKITEQRLESLLE